MTKQDKIKKVMDEFKRGTLKTPDGKVVKNRKQALAIAMSESEDYTEKGELIHQLSIGSVDEALDILKAAGTEDLFEKAKHQNGDMHPNGKWVWVASANGGKGDWRTHGGRAHSKSQAGGSTTSGSTTAPKQSDTPKQKKLRPVGTGTNGPERRRKSSSKPKYSEMSVDDLKKELVGKTLSEEENIKGKKTTTTYKITNVVKFRGKVQIEYANSDEPYVHVLDIQEFENGGYSKGNYEYKYSLK